MMKKNSRLYQHLIILLALCNTSFVLASDNEAVKEKEQAAAMPPAPSGPYRSQTTTNKNVKNKIPVQTPVMAQRPPQQPM
ncbi:MAG: hypothetical protein KAJ39_03550, partial [Gammaproteobacteria bacterium]|nr:hypothetical protein [Gammaproteobacteria bacterium]